MPRIDPVQLLNCLKVLLADDGGIKSQAEVPRLISLMTKYSKKLVSKCIYIQILKCSSTDLLRSFMHSEGGWRMTHGWLTDAIIAKNWPLVQEILELLLLSPTDIDTLKTNNFPKLVKELSKDESNPTIRAYANKLVKQWLKVVKDVPLKLLTLDQLPSILTCEFDEDDVEEQMEYVPEPEVGDEENVEVLSDSEDQSDEVDAPREVKDKIPILKISLKEHKQVTEVPEKSDSDKKHSDRKKDRDKENDKHRHRDSSKSSGSSGKHSSSKSSSSKHSSSDKHRSSSSSSSSKHSSSKSRSERSSSSSSSSKSSSSSSSKSDKDKSRSEKDRSKSDKEKLSFEKALTQADKNKETLEKLQPPSLAKMGKIPKKTSGSTENKPAGSIKEETKKEKPSMSIEFRKPNDPNRPKTVKTFNSKFRSTGLEQEQETKPPPSRNNLAKKPTLPLPSSIPKRPSTTISTDAPAEKKPKVSEMVDKPGAIKLIPPKPKPTYLLESDMFMDALTASVKKEPKKKKRRLSGSKESPGDLSSPPTSPDLGAPSPTVNGEESKPFKFYQDTLETEDEDKSKITKMNVDSESAAGEHEDSDTPSSPIPIKMMKFEEDDEIRAMIDLDMDSSEVVPGLKSALSRHKRKGPKKSLRWREAKLEDITYFELDETERVNVTKNFMDLKHMERVHEREIFQKVRNLPNEDLMEEKTIWRRLIPIDAPHVEYGAKSKERDIQAAREKSVLQCIYFNPSMIPDSPAEADPESFPYAETPIIPLEDLTGNPDGVCDFQGTPWPEPRIAPPQIGYSGMNPMMQMPFAPGFSNPQFNMPNFQPPPGAMPGVEWGNANIMQMGSDMNMSPDMYMNQGPNPGPGMFGPGPVGQYPNHDDMHMNGPMYNQGRPMGPRPQYGRGNMRGGPPRAGGGGGWRGGNPRSAGPSRHGDNYPRGSTRVCIHFQKKGFCRLGDNCQYLHPGVNCPF